MTDPDSTPQHHPLVRAVARALHGRCRVQPRDRLLVAVSGGPDSVALLHALHLLADRRRFHLHLAVAHVHHHLRGDDADADADFVEALADRLDRPFLRADLDLTGDTAPAPRNLQARARRQRYAALRTMAGTFEAHHVATAHHADDQLETLLMRLLRGASFAGLRGIAARRRFPRTDETEPPTSAPLLIRPMLAATHHDALDLLTTLNQPWREDPSNASRTRLRTRLRHDVLPLLRDMQPDAPRKATRLADHARQMNRLLQNEVARHHEHLSPDPDGSRSLDRAEARLMPPLVLAALLRQILTDLGCPPDRLGNRTLAPILRAIRDTAGHTRTFDLPNNLRLTLTRHEVTLHRP